MQDMVVCVDIFKCKKIIYTHSCISRCLEKQLEINDLFYLSEINV